MLDTELIMQSIWTARLHMLSFFAVLQLLHVGVLQLLHALCVT